jgi:hypothetical protein
MDGVRVRFTLPEGKSAGPGRHFRCGSRKHLFRDRPVNRPVPLDLPFFNRNPP